MDAKDVVKELKRRVDTTSQKDVAIALGMTPQFINDVIKGRREVSENLARGLGYAKVVSFIKLVKP